MLNLDKIGATRQLISMHIKSREVLSELDRYPSQAIIGLGQGGGRMAAELSRFGFPTFLVNSSKSDMEEHANLIPEERRIITKSEEYPELEGTDKNAQLGFSIAKENKDTYKQLALRTEVQDADFVWVCVSLGGGTGNGALKVALAYLSKVRASRELPDGKIPLGVICSVPSTDERGSSFRKNALAGANVLQDLIDKKEIGSVLVIDNEKMKNYYADSPLTTYGGTEIDAKSYSNMVVSSNIVEIGSLPLLKGRSVFDKTEFLSTISTPGWMQVSKTTDINEDANLEGVIEKLFKENEILADYSLNRALSGAVAILYPTSKNISPKIADDIYTYASSILDTKVNHSVSTNSSINEILLYGIAVLPNPPLRFEHLREELAQWEQKEREAEEAKKAAASSLKLDEFDDFFDTSNIKKSRRNAEIIFDDEEDKVEAPKVTAADLDNIDF